MADTVLNFTPDGQAGIAVTNTTQYPADVKFTLYNANGSVNNEPGLLNPIIRRIGSGNQLAMLTSEIFNAKPGVRTDGWIQATSSVNGLQGFYFSGDFSNSFDGAEAGTPSASQMIPYVMPGKTRILVTNPSNEAVTAVPTFLDSTGLLASQQIPPIPLGPHQQKVFEAYGSSVRVSTLISGTTVLVTAIEGFYSEFALINGQAADAQAGRWVVPYFKYGGGVVSALVLANLAQGKAFVNVSFYPQGTSQASKTYPFELGAGASAIVDWQKISGALIVPEADGWLTVESSVPLAGTTFVSSNGRSITAMPMQAAGLERILFSRAVTKGMTTSVALVGDSEKAATVTLALVRPDGTTAAQSDPILLLARTRNYYPSISTLIPPIDFEGGFLMVKSSAPIFGMELIEMPNGIAQAVVTPQRASVFTPLQLAAVPVITKVSGDPVPNGRLKIEAQNVEGNSTLFVGSVAIPLAVDLNYRIGDVTLPPSLDPGQLILKIRSGGMDSEPVYYGAPYSADNSLDANTQIINGTALFQAVAVTDNGLDLNQTGLNPIKFAKVEVVDKVTEQVRSVSETNGLGGFRIIVPKISGLQVRVYSRLRSLDLKVLNNAAGSTPYYIWKDFDGADSSDLDLRDTSRNAGAFNILDTLTKANALLLNSVPGFVPPPLTVYWSSSNDSAALAKLTNGAIRTTFFNPVNSAAYILGDRNTDSDEYDDSVILHEYAHLLAARFSKDDSNGGLHYMGDSLDPRIAWSEGWANFFSAAVRGSSVYRDSKAGTNVLRFDIEENVPNGDKAGYTSEASVDGILWDLFDENSDKDDFAQFSFSAIWNAFTDLKNDRNVYLPLFLEHFLQRSPSVSDVVRSIVSARSIDFQPDARPSVTNPFPFLIAPGQSKPGQVDSFTSKRTNLSTSSHFYSLTTTTAGVVPIKLFVTGMGPANNPSANDLDLFLYDSTGKKVIAQSDLPLNGSGEVINAVLPAGTYFIEVRSFYTRVETNSLVFNSGDYKLQIDPIR
jgi:hypothetical protein